MANIKPYKEMSLANLDNGTVISHLTDNELALLTESFKKCPSLLIDWTVCNNLMKKVQVTKD